MITLIIFTAVFLLAYCLACRLDEQEERERRLRCRAAGKK